MAKQWRVAVAFDTTQIFLKGHGTHLAFVGLPGVEHVALADPNHEGLEKRMCELGAKRHYDDYLEMLDREQPQIVVLGSRLPEDHDVQIRAAVERGIHVFCEKPMTSDLRVADELIALAKKHNAKIAVAHLARHALVFQTMKRMIEEGAIGTPLTFYGRGKEDERGGGEDMVVLGTHILDLGCYLFGAPASVSAEITVEGRPLRREDRSVTKEPLGPVAGDNVFALYRFPNSVRGIFESRKGLFRKQVRMGVSVVGTEGILSVRYDNDRKLRLSRTPYPPEDEAAYEEVPLVETRQIPGAEELRDFGYFWYFRENNRFAAWDLIRAIEEERQPLASAYDARKVLEMINGAYASQLTGRVVPLPLAEREHPLEKQENVAK
ncbi:Gfo/Idh/MocA family oxidoreductase [uncultured Victivallis sp.]|uniref:Gfo/Idh/MocA family protein n=1 Tax=uncultured Victivallis sp. TaxID=354118 RepID=UPI0025D768A1|nr:Gfo/Idh/MocA family oxidoreductase [uncultured Victivallis sp.]